MYYVPQTPCCTPQPIVTPCGGDPCSAQPIGSQSVVYSGPNLPCTGIQTCNNLSVAFQKVDEKICDLQDQIDAIVESLGICCTTTTTTSTSSTSTTTSTTTIACPSCNFYSVTNSTLSNVNISYYACGGVFVNASVAGPSTIYICACTGSVVVPPIPGVTLVNTGACPTTTTTTTAVPATTTTTTTAIAYTELSIKATDIEGNPCNDIPPITVYVPLGQSLTTAVTLYTNPGLTIPLTGYQLVVSNPSVGQPVFPINPVTGVVGPITGTICS